MVVSRRGMKLDRRLGWVQLERELQHQRARQRNDAEVDVRRDGTNEPRVDRYIYTCTRSWRERDGRSAVGRRMDGDGTNERAMGETFGGA